MDSTDFMARSTSILLGQDFSIVSMPEVSLFNSAERLIALENKCKQILENIFKYSKFLTKYDITSRDVGSPMIYVHTNSTSRHMHLMEAFPVVAKFDTTSSSRKIEDFFYHPMFEEVIRRYTKSDQKPNLVLRDTRSAEFCYRLSIKVEAMPLSAVNNSNQLVLLHEFLILNHLWERHRLEMLANSCGPDQMIGFPMPFEFVNIVGAADYDFTDELRKCAHYCDISGRQELLANAVIPRVVPDAAVGISSSLSYFSFERLGPSLGYLIDLMRSQGKSITLSSALKVYDQLICRLMVMHKYGVVHCDPNPNCLFFGPGETCNVLYISEFSSALLKPETSAQVPRFHDRFVSYLRFREKRCHYLHDLESAFYVFIYMLIGKLPWDMRIISSAELESNDAMEEPQPGDVQITDKTVTTEDKEKFWHSPEVFNRLFRMTDMEFYEPLYQNFSMDLIVSLFSKTKEALVALPQLPPMSYSKDVFVPGSQVHNIYFGLRRIIATYFRFESLSLSLKDPQGTSKIELLNKQCTTDKRIAWDLSHWCWNYLDPRQNQLNRARSASSIRPASNYRSD